MTNPNSATLHTTKKNQPTLYQIAKEIFKEQQRNDFDGVACYQETNRGHGRLEERTYYAVVAPLNDDRLAKWPKLKTLAMGRFRRTIIGGKETEFIRYYISSLEASEVE